MTTQELLERLAAGTSELPGFCELPEDDSALKQVLAAGAAT